MIPYSLPCSSVNERQDWKPSIHRMVASKIYKTQQDKSSTNYSGLSSCNKTKTWLILAVVVWIYATANALKYLSSNNNYQVTGTEATPGAQNFTQLQKFHKTIATGFKIKVATCYLASGNSKPFYVSSFTEGGEENKIRTKMTQLEHFGYAKRFLLNHRSPCYVFEIENCSSVNERQYWKATFYGRVANKI